MNSSIKKAPASPNNGEAGNKQTKPTNPTSQTMTEEQLRAAAHDRVWGSDHGFTRLEQVKPNTKPGAQIGKAKDAPKS